MGNINVYNEHSFKQEWGDTGVYNQLQDDFDLVLWSTHLLTDIGSFNKLTPREIRGKRIVSAVPFYYINMLCNGKHIFDIGCGWDLYSRYYNNITGLSGDTTEGHVNKQYVREHLETFDNIMSMNALHFIEITQLEQRIQDVISMTKVGGRIFLMLNICHLSGYVTDRIQYVRTIVGSLTEKIISFELDDEKINTNMAEGSFRLVLEKTYE